MTPPWLTVRIASKQGLADAIEVFEFVKAEGGALPPFDAGAHIDVEIRPGLVRQYSLCNPPGETDRYQIAVLRDGASRGGSIAMHDELIEGGLTRISAPRNHFALEPTARRSILLAGGIGATPIICMAEQLNRQGEDFVMHYCTRSRSRTAFHDRLAQGDLARRVRFHFDEGPEAQRLDPCAALGRPEPGVHVYVCGPAGFIDWIFAAAKAQGWPDDQLHREYFSVAEAPSEDGEAFSVRVASTGATYVVPSGRSVVQVLAEHGVEIPVSCQQGVCGSCVTRILEGVPDHRDLVLMGTETDEFTPCCSRSKTPLLVLDL